MSRPDLIDLALDNGGMDLIPDELCARHRIGKDRVWNVLALRLMYADPTGVMFWSTQTIADRLRGIDRRDIRTADSILAEAGLMTPVGKRGRANAYRMIPDLLDAITASHAAGDLAGDLAGELAGDLAGDLAGELAGELAGIPATKGREEKRREGTRASTRPTNTHSSRNVRTPKPVFITECPTHGLDNPFDGKPCGTCKEARHNRKLEAQILTDQARALAEPITRQGLATVTGILGDTHGLPA